MDIRSLMIVGFWRYVYIEYEGREKPLSPHGLAGFIM